MIKLIMKQICDGCVSSEMFFFKFTYDLIIINFTLISIIMYIFDKNTYD